MLNRYAFLLIFATVLAACSSPDPTGGGGFSPVGCDTAADCSDTHHDICIECRAHECAEYPLSATDAGVCS